MAKRLNEETWKASITPIRHLSFFETPFDEVFDLVDALLVESF